jgi:predicted metal-dependent phosphoesterase TrpH
MSWYKLGKTITALRKNMMRVDLHIHIGDEGDYPDPQIQESAIKSILSACIIKGLDIVGLVSHGSPKIGQEGIRIAKEQGIDLFVLAGEEYLCTDKFRIIVFNLPGSLPPNMDYATAAKYIHDNNGIFIVIDITKRQAQVLNKTLGTPHQFFEFMGSAAKNAKMLEETNVYTLASRKELEKMGFIPEGFGREYTPKYLENVEKAERQKSLQEAPING